MEINKCKKVTFEFEDGSTTEISGRGALIIQARINSSGILAGIEVDNEQR